MIAEVGLELPQEAGREMWVVFEVGDVEAPLMLQKRFQVLSQGNWKALKLEPFVEGCLEGEKVWSFGWIESAVHVGI